MDPKALFDLWAPPAATWSRWAKTAPFARINEMLPTERAPLPPSPSIPTGVPPLAGECALVVHLPGSTAITMGLALAGSGYRPVPLFNACSPRMPERATTLAVAIDTDSILCGLVEAAPAIGGLPLPATAPPAFLIDAKRFSPRCPIVPTTFDNRSVVFASDFPSAKFLRAQGISRALVIHDETLHLGRDLLTALSPWRQDGLPVTAVALDGNELIVDWRVAGFLGEWRERLYALLTLRRGIHGGFGRFVPESSGG